MAFSYAQRSTFCTERRPISFWAVQALLSRGFKQPLEFSNRDRLRARMTVFRPMEFLLFQALLPQAKSIAMPVQYFNLVARTIDEYIQRTSKRIQTQFLLDHHAQPVNRFPEVDRIAAQIDLFDRAAGMH